MEQSDFSFQLDGKVAVVTGAAGGLGAAIAVALANAGAFVVCADIHSEANEAVARRIGATRAEAILLDVRNEDSVQSMAQHAAAVSGNIDVLVACAGIGGRSPAATYDDDLWSRVIDINLSGLFRTCRAVGAHMIRQSIGGAIINIASVVGTVGLAGSAGYQASKGGVVQLTRSLAIEWATHGVRVNAISPGHVATPLVQRQWEIEPELKPFFLDRTPLGKLAEPEDIAAAAVFLASPAASMVTGQNLAIDGGYTAQ